MQHQYHKRVYFADTDAGQVVYHAQYLNFFAQARTEWARSSGWHMGDIVNQGILMPVHSVDIKYHKPAMLDDLLVIYSTISRIRRCSVSFYQYACRHDKLDSIVCEAQTTIACVNRDLQIRPWPPGLWQDMIGE